MIDYRIFENAYLVAFLTFIILSVLFYLFGIGFNNKKEFTYRYQIGISLLVWLFWKFYLYPSKYEEKPVTKQIDPHTNMNLKMVR